MTAAKFATPLNQRGSGRRGSQSPLLSGEGGDADAGRRMYGVLRDAGLKEVKTRAAALALPAGPPYLRWPLESTTAKRPRTREWGLVEESEWEQLVAGCAQIADDPNIFLISFMTVLVRIRIPIGKRGE
jgi:hypothetical protein